MAKIQIGEWGRRAAPAVTGNRVPASAFVSADPQTAGALQSMAEGMVTKVRAQEHADAKAIADREVREAERRQGELKRAQNVGAYAGFQADLDEMLDGLTGQLTSNAVTRDKLPEVFDKNLADLKKKRLDGLDPEQQALVGAHFMTAERGARSRLRKVTDLHERQERVAVISTTLEDFQRLAVKDPAKAIGQANMLLDAEGPGVLGADKVALHKQQFAEKAYASHYTSRLNMVRHDANGLAALEADIAKTDALDPDRKNVLLGRVMGMRETLASKAERAQASRLRTVERQMNTLNSMTLQGFDVPADQLMAVASAAKGTELEPIAQQMVLFSRESARFRAMPPRAQEAYLNNLEANVRKSPSPGGIEFLGKLRTIAGNQQQLVADDPISFAGQKGLAEVVPFDFTKPDTFKDQMLARLSVVEGMQKQYGAPLKVLTKQEAATLSDFMRRATSEDKAGILGALKGAVPSAPAYQAIMQQIAPDSPVTAWAGALMGRRPMIDRNLLSPDVETKAGRVAELMLRGEALINPSAGDRKADGKGKPMVMPKDKDLTGVFEGLAGEAYRARPDAHNIAMQSARAVYAALSADAGDYSGELDGTRWRQSVELATGGFTNIGGVNVVRPYGMEEGEFKTAVAGELGKLSQSGRVTLTKPMLSRMQLESAGDAKYLVRSGTGYLLDKTGSPVLIDLFAASQQPQGLKDAEGRDVVGQIPK